MLARAAPVLFVLTWSSGFVVARYAVPHAGPELILLVRMALTAAGMGAFAALRRERLPRGRALGLHLLAGALMNGVYLCTGWWAIERGMPAGIMSLLGALQPLVVAALSFAFLGERLAARGWTGLAVGVGGVALVLQPLLARGVSAPAPPYVIAAALASILAMSVGVMIQRGALARSPLAASSAVQNVGGALVALLAASATGERRWDNAPALWLALAWSVVLLSGGALSLLVWMTRSQGATRVSALLLLVPPLTALETWALFGERLGPVQMVGFAGALAGVLLARSAPARARDPDAALEGAA